MLGAAHVISQAPVACSQKRPATPYLFPACSVQYGPAAIPTRALLRSVTFVQECNLSNLGTVAIPVTYNPLPIAALAIKGAVRGLNSPERSEPVYGGYANGRGEIVLFAKDLAYRINFKHNIIKQRPPLNSGAKARYEATEAGEEFVYGNKTFRRLSLQQIEEICKESNFRVGSRF